MKAIIAHRAGDARLVQLPEPPLAPATVLMRVTHCAIMLPHEMRVLERMPHGLSDDQDGVPLGSMVSGIADAVGERVRHLKAGLRVAAFGAPYVYHAGMLSVPGNMVVELPKKVNHEEGAFAGQGALALQLVRETGASLGESVVVFGAGMTGILAAQIARAAGMAAMLVDDSDHLLTKARNVGVQHTCRPDQEELIREIDRLTGGHGADAAIVTPDAGATGLAWAALVLRPRATIVANGDSSEAVPVSMLEDKELTLRTVRHAGAGHGDPHWEQQGIAYPRALVRWTVQDNMRTFLDLLAERKVQIAPLVTERTPLERAQHAYEKIQRAPQAVVGAVLTL